jgi:glucose/arabinose dehydrogenase
MSQDIIELELFAEDYSVPVDIVHVGDNRLFVVERRGMIKIIDTTGQKMGDPYLDISSRVSNNGGEQGLLGMCFHPDFSSNGYFYVNYTPSGARATVIARFQVDSANQNVVDPSTEKLILYVDQPFGNHNGGDLEFGPDGYLYIGFGDGGSANDPQNRSQNPQMMLGKMLRIDVDNGDPYSIPPDNPFANDDSTLDEIWALGLRNPWRYSFDSETGHLYMADVGQNDWEEINVQESMSQGGLNYGWRCYEGDDEHITSNCSADSIYTFPVYAYPHESGFQCSGSVTGGYVYRGSNNPDLFGKYIFSDYCTGKFRSWSTIDSSSEIIFEGEELAYTTFGEDASQELYVATQDGEIYKIWQTTSSIERDPALMDLVIYPNPASNVIHFNTGSILLNEQLDVQVFNMLGVNSLSKSISIDEGLNIASLGPGVYIVKVIVGKEYFIGKVALK